MNKIFKIIFAIYTNVCYNIEKQFFYVTCAVIIYYDTRIVGVQSTEQSAGIIVGVNLPQHQIMCMFYT